MEKKQNLKLLLKKYYVGQKENQYGNEAEAEVKNRYIAKALESQKVKKLKPKNTLTNKLRVQRNKENFKAKFCPDQNPVFKMKQFQNIESKIKLNK